MTAARHVSPHQLRMFIPAGELADPSKVEHYDVKYAPDADYEKVKAQKIKEATTGAWQNTRWGDTAPDLTLRASIRTEGIRNPVNLYPGPTASTPGMTRKPMLGQGHHRVFTAADLDPKTEVPVVWKHDDEY